MNALSFPQNRLSTLSPELRARLERRLRGENRRGAIPRRPADAEIPLSFAQERMWLHAQSHPDSIVYNRPAPFCLTGRLDVDALERALTRIVERHETFRTSIVVQNARPVVRLRDCEPVQLRIADVSADPDPEARAAAIAEKEARGAFDLESGALYRAGLVKLHQEQHWLLLTMHHLMFDAWSLSVLLSELAAEYESCVAGHRSPLAPLEVSYSDFSVWERERAESARLERERAWWRERVAEACPLEVPADRSRASGASDRSESRPLVLPERLVHAVRETAARENSTPFAVVMAGLGALLHRWTGQSDITIGSPFAGRTTTSTERMIGVFINTLPLHLAVTGDSEFREILRQASQAAIDAQARQEVPLQWIHEDVFAQRSAGNRPFLQTLLIYERFAVSPRVAAGVEFRSMEIDCGVSPTELCIELNECPEGIAGKIAYRSDLWDAGSIDRMAESYLLLLEGALADPDRKVKTLPVVSDADRRRILTGWSSSAGAASPATIHELVSAQSQRTPSAVAIVSPSDGREITYAQLDAHSNRLARMLGESGIGPECRVAIVMNRCVESLIGMLGVLKAGAAFVPLDPASPRERGSRLLEDVDAAAILTAKGRSTFSAMGRRQIEIDLDSLVRGPCTSPGVVVPPESLAYVMFTSGSTGTPAGVMVEHRALVNYSRAAQGLYGLSAGDRVPQLASLTFDACLEEIFPTWISGGTLILRSEETLGSVGQFFRDLNEWQITVASLTTAFWNVVCESLDERHHQLPTSLRVVIIGGERARRAHYESWRKHAGDRIRLVNTYGPTEATIVATACDLIPGSDVDQRREELPIGRPIAGVEAYVLDSDHEAVGIGIPGELYLGGVALARGYVNRPDLTADRFVRHPFHDDSDARLYRTGDRVRWTERGLLEFLGRVDEQFKVRGFRVEPGEIEAALLTHPHLRQACVVFAEQSSGDRGVTAYVVAANSGSREQDWRRFLSAKLPDYMVPSRFVELESLPLSAHGKVDRRALDRLTSQVQTPAASPIALMTAVEEIMGRIWAEVLKLDQVSPDDNFFALGGHSLLAFRVLSRIHASHGVQVPFRTLFESPTLAEFSQAVTPALEAQTAATVFSGFGGTGEVFR